MMRMTRQGGWRGGRRGGRRSERWGRQGGEGGAEMWCCCSLMESSWPRFTSGRLFISHFQPNFSQHLHFTSWDNNVDCCKISFRFWLICCHNNRRNSQVRPIHRHFLANEYFWQIQKVWFCVKQNYSTHELWWELSLFFSIFSNFGENFPILSTVSRTIHRDWSWSSINILSTLLSPNIAV